MASDASLTHLKNYMSEHTMEAMQHTVPYEVCIPAQCQNLWKNAISKQAKVHVRSDIVLTDSHISPDNHGFMEMEHFSFQRKRNCDLAEFQCKWKWETGLKPMATTIPAQRSETARFNLEVTRF